MGFTDSMNDLVIEDNTTPSNIIQQPLTMNIVCRRHRSRSLWFMRLRAPCICIEYIRLSGLFESKLFEHRNITLKQTN